MKSKIKNWFVKGTITSLVLASFMTINTAQAASLTSLSDNMDRLADTTAANHTIQFVTPSGVQAGETITLTFEDFTGESAIVHTDVDLATAATCSGFTDKTLAATPSGASWGVAASGDTITITSGTDTITATHCVQIQIGTNATNQATGVNQITNGDVADDNNIVIAGTFGDTGTINVDIIADDQVVITATVGPSISFSISDNTIGFGALDFSAATYANGAGTGSASEVEAHTLSASTNASSGYVMYVSGDTLESGVNSITAIGGANTSSAPGTEQFGVRYSATGGSGSVTAPYSASGFAYDGATAPDQIASAAGATSATTYSARYLANIDLNTEAGAYSTTLTYTATASF